MAAHDLKTEWVVIKSISRYADTSAQSTEHWFQFSCAMAASVVNKILSEPSVFEDWPHYQGDNSNSNSNTRTQSEGTFCDVECLSLVIIEFHTDVPTFFCAQMLVLLSLVL